jgi:hypothetical protein
MIGRSQGLLAAATCVLGFGACSDPNNHTDLRPDGPPEVLTVLASDDADNAGIAEAATFCKTGDDKRPGLIPANPNGPYQVCPDDLSMGVDELTDTQPFEWYVRIQFDELLNPDIEDLNPIIENGVNTGLFSGSLANTQPVTLTCGGVAVPYDGYYDPSGNSFTWPPGPSLFIQPTDTTVIPSGSGCSISIKDNVVDKSGNTVPSSEAGPYTFKIADLALNSSDPGAPKDLTKPSIIDAGDPLILSFNAAIDPASLTADEVSIHEVADCGTTTLGAEHVAVIAPNPKNPLELEVSVADAPAMKAWDAGTTGKTYSVTFAPTASVSDLAGATGALPTADKLTICFSVTP